MPDTSAPIRKRPRRTIKMSSDPVMRNPYVVLVYQGGGFGPVSNWAILTFTNDANRANDIKNVAVRNGERVKIVRESQLGDIFG